MTKDQGRPETPEELIEKHDGDLLVEMANDGNVTARVVIEMVAERDPRVYGQYRDQLDDVQGQGER